MCRSIQRPIVGASLTRKNVANAVKPRNTISDVSPEIPRATPYNNVRPMFGTASLISFAADEADVIPRFSAQPRTRSTAVDSEASIWTPCEVMPASTSPTVTTVRATSPTASSPAPAARGQPRRSSRSTATPLTALTTNPAISGSTMLEVCSSSQTRPTTTRRIPTISHAPMPHR